MFRSSAILVIAVILIMNPGVSNRLFGQQEMENIGVLKNQTHALYEAGDYAGALTGFNLLRGKYPAEVMYRYYSGVCMVKLNRNLDESIEHLYFASSRGVPEDSYFYLGLAYHLQYNFSEAEKYFRRFEREGTRQQVKDLDVKHYINTTSSAAGITASYNPFEVLNVAFINLYDSAQFSQVKMRGGDLSRKPAQFFQDFEDRGDLTGLMFIPKNIDRGDYLYYAGYYGNGKGGSELFRVKRGNTRFWSDPEPIKDLNTEMDELLPYFDPIESDLYFASNGRPGIGGFDLYKSHYDSERDEWSEPMNLGFPVNSVVDDYLLLPGNDLGMVMFFTARQGTDSTVTVYRVRLMEPKKPLSASDTRKIMQIAMLGGVAAETMAEIQIVENPAPLIKTPPAITQPVAVKSDYQVTLAKALHHQSVSDSLSQLATGARIKVRESGDPNDRWVWQKQIMVWEKKAKDEQVLADELFASLNEDVRDKPETDHPGTIRVDTVINEITVYTYTEAAREPVKPVASSSLVKTEPVNEKRSEEIYRFEVLPSSPYSDSNPIPANVSLPKGVFYRIQLGAYSKEIPPENYDGLSPITAEHVNDRGIIRYYVGKFSRYSDASMALQKVKTSGYPDAFIVAYYNGQKTSTTKAQALEQ